MELSYAATAARFRAVASRIRFRNRNDFGVASTYSSISMYSIARSRVIRSGASSNGGNKTVNYSVSANSGAARTGTIVIAGLTFTVTQAGSSCTYKVTLGTMTNAPGGFNGSAIVSTSGACTWSASSNVTWINLTTPSPVTGPATARFFVANNPNSSSRTGVLTIAGYSIQVTEATKNNVKVGKPVR